MLITPEIMAFIKWNENIRKKMEFGKSDPTKKQSFIIKFKASLSEMSDTLTRLENLLPDSILTVLNAGIDALHAADLKSQALKQMDRYLECYASFKFKRGRDKKIYRKLTSIRENKLPDRPSIEWKKVKIFEMNVNDKGTLSILIEHDSNGPTMVVLPATMVQMKIKKMFLTDEEFDKSKHIRQATPEEVNLLIKKMAVHYNIMTNEQSNWYKRKFNADTAALKLYSIAEAIIVNKDIKAAKLILAAKVIDALPLTDNARNYFRLRAKHKVADAWAGLKMDYPTLKRLEDVVHPDRLVILEQEEGLRKYFMRTYVDDKFHAENYNNKVKKETEKQMEIINE